MARSGFGELERQKLAATPILGEQLPLVARPQEDEAVFVAVAVLVLPIGKAHAFPNEKIDDGVGDLLMQAAQVPGVGHAGDPGVAEAAQKEFAGAFEGAAAVPKDSDRRPRARFTRIS